MTFKKIIFPFVLLLPFSIIANVQKRKKENFDNSWKFILDIGEGLTLTILDFTN